MDKSKVTPKEAKVLYDILVRHEARTLSPGCDDPDNKNIMLDHLRSMLMDIADGEAQAQEDRIKAVGQLIHDEDQEMDLMEESQRKDEKLSFILGLVKALSMIQAV